VTAAPAFASAFTPTSVPFFGRELLQTKSKGLDRPMMVSSQDFRLSGSIFSRGKKASIFNLEDSLHRVTEPSSFLETAET
jgi:hypothetical protein